MKRIRRSPHAKEGACHGVEVASEEPRVPADGANRAKEGDRRAGPALSAILVGPGASAGAEIDAGVALLVEALNRVGATTESSCEGHLRRLSTGERCRPCLPYVVFRARCDVVDLVLEIARELYYGPPEEGFLHALWCVESCPAPEGGILHTLTPHPSFTIERIGKAELAAAQQDARTLGEFLLRQTGK